MPAVYLIIDLLLSSIGTQPDRSQKVTSAEISCLTEHAFHMKLELLSLFDSRCQLWYGFITLSIMGRHESRSSDGLEKGFIQHDLNALLHKRHTFQFISCLRFAMSILACRGSRFNALTVYRKSYSYDPIDMLSSEAEAHVLLLYVWLWSFHMSNMNRDMLYQGLKIT